MKLESNLILSKEDIDIKAKRIALQILEACIDDDEIIVAGIMENGFIFGEMLAKHINSISGIKVNLAQVEIDKKNPLNSVKVSLPAKDYKYKSLILVDDVLNTGSTLMFAAKHFLDVPLKQFKTAVLVDRNHKKYPIKADFKGISLSTSLSERVEVNFTGSAKAELF